MTSNVTPFKALGVTSTGVDRVSIRKRLQGEFYPDVIKTDRGIKLLATRENLEHMFDGYGIEASYDVIKKDVVVNIPSISFSVDNSVNATLAELNSICARNQLPVATVNNGLVNIADSNQKNPVLDWIYSREWDGVDRIDSLIESIHVPEHQKELRSAYIKSWLMQSVGILFNTGFLKAENVLVFSGDQGKGKTTWFNDLLPNTLSEYRIDGVTLKPEDKDSVMSCVSHWLVELGELDSTFSKSEIGQLKAFLSKRSDKFRRPYDRADSQFSRRTSFFASVNDPDFLVDKTGNRRYMVLDVQHIDRINMLDIQQIWAQVYAEMMTLGGADSMPWELSDDVKKLQQVANEGFTKSDPITEVLDAKLDHTIERNFTGTATIIAKELGLRFEDKRTISEIGSTLRKLGYESTRKKHGNEWAIPRIDGMKDWRMFEKGFGGKDLSKKQVKQIIIDGRTDEVQLTFIDDRI